MENLSIVQISAEIQAPLGLVWRAWTTPRHIRNWNFASDSWHCPHASLHLKEGGDFKYRMEAKDGSDGFDFMGVFVEVKEMEKVSYSLGDGRKVWIRFEQKEDRVLVTEEFEAESSHAVELQKNGWQAILNNFKTYSEQLVQLDKLYFEKVIAAPVDKVFRIMLAPDTYTRWTEPFHPGSFFRGDWKQGEKIHFIGTDEEGNEGGMVARVKVAIPNKQISLEHYGLLEKGQEITEGPEVQGWAGAMEEYFFETVEEGTLLRVSVDSNKEFGDYFKETWPKALDELKSICEENKNQ